MKRLYELLLACMALVPAIVKGQTYQQQYTKCAEKLKGSKIGSEYYMRSISKVFDCMVGANAPDVKAESITGEEIELARLKGQVVVLNFWNTACKPCIEEMPALNELVEIYQDKPVAFIALAPEDAPTIRHFLSKYSFTFTQIADAKEMISEQFLTGNAYPYTIIIDQEGKVKKMWFGGWSDKEIVLKHFQTPIDECLAKK